MLYLTGSLPAKPNLRQLLVDNGFGVLLTPFSERVSPPGWVWAADNGCFGKQWNSQTWVKWLQERPDPASALFATVPDSVGNHPETLQRWGQWHQTVADLGYKTAFVLQDGAQSNEMPWDEMEALFIGGTTEYKLSNDARRIVDQAKELGKWVHMGRVNSQRRIKIAYDWGCDSVDGTFVAFGPDINTPKLVRMFRHGTQPALFAGY